MSHHTERGLAQASPLSVWWDPRLAMRPAVKAWHDATLLAAAGRVTRPDGRAGRVTFPDGRAGRVADDMRRIDADGR